MTRAALRSCAAFPGAMTRRRLRAATPAKTVPAVLAAGLPSSYLPSFDGNIPGRNSSVSLAQIEGEEINLDSKSYSNWKAHSDEIVLAMPKIGTKLGSGAQRRGERGSVQREGQQASSRAALCSQLEELPIKG
eukprot:6176936-Pleurochrysis_carterae.AAC.2